MVKKIILVMTIMMELLVMSTTPALAQLDRYPTGEAMLSSCETAVILVDKKFADETMEEAEHAGLCLGFIQGILSSETANAVKLAKLNGDELGDKHYVNYCLPENVTVEQVIRVAVKHFKENPEKLHTEAIVLINAALAKSFPCNRGMDSQLSAALSPNTPEPINF